MFGFTPEEIEAVGLPLSLTVLMVWMLLIIWNLAKESKAGKFGTIVLFFVLSFGMIGFVAKTIIQKFLGL
ncbi:MAG: DUF2788 domain-containing protein [Candidatus Methylophosphatis roskildensis]|jgi:hypothetical protein|uniref:DUF2788 domain-containing protein n=1 Tax=Candidatus Methylophosphatis roskildensis TaxID=2899263 RepID=A0A9D7HP35_9PROT|nr:DUF2788 domain-containing protein [Candidatus Methylophosphatis roskildensis]MBK7235484.1 DUF2788 domain-containing protein [Sterolibacteriaceae bacterium]MBK7663393.1 DUF2788 domain-containing protein [Sterolibacteriaceae bacterium]MBK9083733.1 DUF2788 domain-containing protein [Sterolibacteriaceae bacterium]